MKLAVIHTVLLVLALGAAYATWTRGDAPAPAPESVVMWRADREDLTRIVYERPDRRAVLELRRDEVGSYVWGTVTMRTRGADSTTAPDSVVQFVGNDQADGLLETLAEPRAARYLGRAEGAQEEEFGFTGSDTRLSVEIDGETRTLRVGASVFASGDRYLQDVESGRAYVFSGRALNSLENAASILAERRVLRDVVDRTASVTVRTPRGERTMEKVEGAGAAPVWTPPGQRGRADTGFGTFMERLQQLAIMRYEPGADRSSLRSLATVEYRNARDNPIGRLELLRSDAEGGPAYFVLSTQTRVPARVYPGSAEPLDQDLAQLF